MQNFIMNNNIKLLVEGIFDDDIFNLNNMESDIDLTQTIYKYHPKNKNELKKIIKERIKKEGYKCNLNDIDTSEITDMSDLFLCTYFDGDISMWDVSNVIDMTCMFAESHFSGDISNWNINPKCNTTRMFYFCPIKNEHKPKRLLIIVENLFDDDLFNSDSDIDLTQTIYRYYPETKDELKLLIKERIEKEGYRCNLNDINTSKITDMSNLFYDSHFYGDISMWDVSNVTNMTGMFYNSNFNGDLSQWNIHNVKYMVSMFVNSKFNGDISNWDVSNVKNASFMFFESKFDGDISSWKFNKLCDTDYMYNCCPLLGNKSNQAKKCIKF